MEQPTEAGGLLLGRSHEMDVLVGALGSAAGGQGGLVILSGEAGIGKSRLADALAAVARGRGARVVWGRCWEAGGAPTFWPWVQAVRAYVRDVDPGALLATMGQDGVEVARIVPDLLDFMSGVRAPRQNEGDDGRLRSFAAMSSFLVRAAVEPPLVVILDDMHAADEPSLLLLRFLAPEIADSRLLVIAIYRESELDAADPRHALLAELARTPAARRLSPRALSSHDVLRYLESVMVSSPPAGLAEAIQVETAGNPLFVTEVVRLLGEEGRLSAAHDPTLRPFGLSEGVQAVIRRRLARLSGPCRDLLARVSVLGNEISLNLLARMEELPADDLVTLLDEAVGARVLVELTAPVGRWRFGHGLIREVLYTGLPGSVRLRLHRRVAETLEALSANAPDPPLAELAHHFVAAGGGLKAAEYARRAAERATDLYGHEEAARLYRLALQVDALDEASRCGLRIGLGGALTRSGKADQARTEFLEAAAIAERLGLVEELARAALGYGGQLVWLRAGSDDVLIPLLEKALEALGSRDNRLRVRLLARLSGALRDEPKVDRRAALSAEALQIARGLGDLAVVGQAIVARCWAIMGPDAVALMAELTQELLRLAPLTDDRELVVDSHWMRWNLIRVTGAEHSELLAEFNALERTARDLRQPHRWWAAGERTILALLEGRVADADGFLPAMRQSPDPFSYRAALFLTRREQDRLEEVAQPIREAVRELPGYPLLACLVAYTDAHLGLRAIASEELRRLSVDGFAAIPRDWGWLSSMIFLGEAAILIGDRVRARELETLLGPYAGLFGTASGEGGCGPVSRVLGLLAAFDNRLDEGLVRLESGFRESARMGASLWETRIAVEQAEVLLRRNEPADRETARALLATASRTSLDLGLVAIERQAAAALAGLDAVDSADGGALDRQVRSAREIASRVPAATFHREGDTWAIDSGSPFRLRDTKGLRYLAILLAEPGREFHALDLVARVDAPGVGAILRTDAAAARSTEGAVLAEDGLSIEAGGDGVELLDAEAKAAYRQRLGELSAELEEAEAYNDPSRAERARSEIDALERELAGAFGLGGRARQAISPAERARQSVSKAIRETLRRIKAEDDDLHGHLARSIRTGIYCVYDPDPAAAPTWSF